MPAVLIEPFAPMHPILFQIGPLIIPSYGALAAVGVLLSLALAQTTARLAALNPRHAWNMIVLAVFAGLTASRLLLIVLNLSDLRRHPSWLLTVAMVHHPLLSGVGILAGAIAILIYTRWAHLSLTTVADCLAAPLALGIAAEQLGALLAGSDYGRDTTSTAFPWAITYTNPLAARWSDAPLGIPVYPVQAYAALGALLLAALCYAWLNRSRRIGDTAGIFLLGLGILLFTTELFRDWEGRGVLFRQQGGLVDAPQLVGLGLVVAGGLVLANWRSHPHKQPDSPQVLDV